MDNTNPDILAPRAADVSAPIETVTLEGVTYKLVFNNRAIIETERASAQYCDYDLSYFVIIQKASRGQYTYMLLVIYGALRAGGSDMSWDKFIEVFTLANVLPLQSLLARGIAGSMPTKEGDTPKTAPEAKKKTSPKPRTKKAASTGPT